MIPSLFMVSFPEARETYFFKDYSDALASFNATYSRRGRISAHWTGAGQRIELNVAGAAPEHVGTIVDVVGWATIYDRPTHF